MQSIFFPQNAVKMLNFTLYLCVYIPLITFHKLAGKADNLWETSFLSIALEK